MLTGFCSILLLDEPLVLEPNDNRLELESRVVCLLPCPHRSCFWYWCALSFKPCPVTPKENHPDVLCKLKDCRLRPGPLAHVSSLESNYIVFNQ